MPTINTGIKLDSQLLNLKEIQFSEVRPEVGELLVNNEEMIAAFKTVRDQVVFISVFKNPIFRSGNRRSVGY